MLGEERFFKRVVRTFIAFALVYLGCVSLVAHAANFQANLTAPATNTTGDYTVSWPPVGHPWTLEEKVGSGAWNSVQTSGNSYQATNQQSATYTYRLHWHQCYYSCNDLYSEEVSVVVQTAPPPPPPQPELLSAQLAYEYEIRSGDFNGDGFTDVLLDRVTPGGVDGSLQPTILSGSSSGLVESAPDATTLSNARANPINPQLAYRNEDRNFDGVADVILAGLSSIGSSGGYSANELIIYASGTPGIANPLGIQFIDQPYVQFFFDLAGAITNPNFFNERANAALVPFVETQIDYYAIPSGINCTPFYSVGSQPLPNVNLGITVGGQDCNLNGWYIGAIISTQVSQTVQNAWHPQTAHAKNAMDDIEDDDFSQGDPLQRLSDVLENVIGVPSFGIPQPLVDPNNAPVVDDYVVERQESEDAYGEFVVAMFDYLFADNSSPSQWEKHVYETGAEDGTGVSICSTTSPTDVIDRVIVNPPGPGGMPGMPHVMTESIDPAHCTLQNVFCWAKKNPAPREGRNEQTISHEGDSTLRGGNPIRTYLFENEFVLVNETRNGHVLHDPLQTLGCGNKSTIEGLNSGTGDNGRCAYVRREVLSSPGEIRIFTHGEGHNPPNIYATLPDLTTVNEIGGRIIFNEVDEWIRQKLATEGACTDD